MPESTPRQYPQLAPHGWASSFPAFREAAAPYVRSRLVAFVPDASPEQIAAWDESIPPLQREIGEVLRADDSARGYGTILEYQLPLNHRRPDVLLLTSGGVMVVEAKGKDRPTQADIDQVAAYARDLHAYHESCADRPVRAVLMLTRASGRLGQQSQVHVIGPDALDEVIREFDGRGDGHPVDANAFLDPARYRPLPSLVQAARELFQSGSLRRIERASAATEPALAALSQIVREAAATRTRHLVLLTGSPGTGKTLVGLQLVHSSFLDDLAVPRHGRREVPAVFLSGNGPLVEVLQYELKGAGGGSKTFVRDVKSYVERYLGAERLVPNEHVVVFDEAQRAWDASKVAREHKSATQSGSEPEHLIAFAERIPEWSVVVGLIGSGQEIHDGEEAGLGQWRWALDRASQAEKWVVSAPSAAAAYFEGWTRLRSDEALNLETELRYHSANDVHRFVAGLLDLSETADLAGLAAELEHEGFHLRLSRDLEVARQYLRERYADNPDARFGLVASSRDVSLERFGVRNGWNATKSVRKGPWYSEGDDDPWSRSCRALIDCVTEFGCQGLELDAALVAWGTDFMLQGAKWTNAQARRYAAPHLIHDAFQLRLNAYRVLLTRGRDAAVVFVPPLSVLDDTYRWLLEAGFRELDDSHARRLGADSLQPRLAQKGVDEIIAEARSAPPDRRIEWRDALASYGQAALPALVEMASDGAYGSFAVLTIRKIGELGARYEAARALRSIDTARLNSPVLADLNAAIGELDPRPTVKGTRAKAAPSPVVHGLRAGSVYARKDLHAHALGGNRQKGISYPANGEHVLLFSRGSAHAEHGYDDHWIDDEHFAYFGEWSGPGDMTLTGGNEKIVERGRELYLFIEKPGIGQAFQGRFELVGHDREQVKRDGRAAWAIVFRLRKAADEVRL